MTRLGSPASPRMVPVDVAACRASLRRRERQVPFPTAAADTETMRTVGGSSKHQEQKSEYRFRPLTRNLVAIMCQSTGATQRHVGLQR